MRQVGRNVQFLSILYFSFFLLGGGLFIDVILWAEKMVAWFIDGISSFSDDFRVSLFLVDSIKFSRIEHRKKFKRRAEYFHALMQRYDDVSVLANGVELLRSPQNGPNAEPDGQIFSGLMGIPSINAKNGKKFHIVGMPPLVFIKNDH